MMKIISNRKTNQKYFLIKYFFIYFHTRKEYHLNNLLMEELVKANPALLIKICTVLDKLKIVHFFKDDNDSNIVAENIRNHLQPIIDGNFHTCQCGTIFSLEDNIDGSYKYGEECRNCDTIYCNSCANIIKCFSCGDEYCDKCVTYKCAFCDVRCCRECYKFDRNHDTYDCVNHPKFISCYDCGYDQNLCQKHCPDCSKFDKCDSIDCIGKLCSICDIHSVHDTCGKKFCKDCLYKHTNNKCLICKKICCNGKYCSKECIETARNILLVEESKISMI